VKKIAISILLTSALLSGCMLKTNPDLSDVSPRTFESLPYAGGGLLCRTPVPVPDLTVVSRTIHALAGSGGRIREVSIPSGVAFGVWTSDVRSLAIRNYIRSLTRTNKVLISVRLSRIDRSTPYLSRTFPVRTRHAFLAARWKEGDRTMAMRGFFTRIGSHVVPVFSLEEHARGWFACRTATPGYPGGGISFDSSRATVRSGTETLTIDWEAKDAKR
jgi:hypothetical protein